MTPFVTQIKFYIPEENRYYGHCSRASAYCYWSPNNLLLEYIDESTYNEKQLGLTTVYASGLDDMTLTVTPAASDNPQIGRKSLKISVVSDIYCRYSPQTLGN